MHERNMLESVEKKLSNEGFTKNADPEVIAKECKKKEDTENRIRSLNKLKQWHELIVDHYKKIN